MLRDPRVGDIITGGWRYQSRMILVIEAGPWKAYVANGENCSRYYPITGIPVGTDKWEVIKFGATQRDIDEDLLLVGEAE